MSDATKDYRAAAEELHDLGWRSHNDAQWEKFRGWWGNQTAALRARVAELEKELKDANDNKKYGWETAREAHIVYEKEHTELLAARTTISTKQARIQELENALKPFAGCETTDDGSINYDFPPMGERIVDWFGMTDFDTARAALALAEQKGK